MGVCTEPCYPRRDGPPLAHPDSEGRGGDGTGVAPEVIDARAMRATSDLGRIGTAVVASSPLPDRSGADSLSSARTALRYPIRIAVILTRRYALRKESKKSDQPLYRRLPPLLSCFFTLCVVSAPKACIAYNIIWHTDFMRRNFQPKKFGHYLKDITDATEIDNNKELSHPA